VPVITTNATGSIDTISSGRTGLLTEIGDWELMKSHIMNLYNNPQLLKKMSSNAKEEVLKKYDSEIIWQELSSFYSDLLEDKNVK
jgi:glycosyltransferase involved in cell wall biosynthesis